MTNYIEIAPEPDLLAQIIGELLAIATDPDEVRTGHGERGMVLTVPEYVADAWYSNYLTKQQEKATEQQEQAPEVEAPETTPGDEAPVAVESEPLPVPEVSTPVQQPAPLAQVPVGVPPVPEVPKVVDIATIVVPPQVTPPVPVKRGPGRPRKITSASASEVQ